MTRLNPTNNFSSPNHLSTTLPLIKITLRILHLDTCIFAIRYTKIKRETSEIGEGGERDSYKSQIHVYYTRYMYL